MSRFLQKIFLSRLFDDYRSGTKIDSISTNLSFDSLGHSNLIHFQKAKSRLSSVSMKMILFILFGVTLSFLNPVETRAQFVINNQGCVIGDFGVNSSLYANEALAGSTAPAGPVDWFKKSSGRNVIIQDQATVNALNGRLLNEVDPVFEVRMNGSLGSYADYVDAQNYKVLIDAIWARDYNSFSDNAVDFSGFNQSAKNGQNPSVDWLQQSRNIGGKNDVIDVAGHMFRTVTPTSDDLWFMGLINIAKPNGDSYMDFEFFVDDVKVVNGAFTTAGADAGHTAFQFNADGSIKRVGDMIYNMGLVNGGSQADVEIRIWVSKADYDAYFATPPANLPFTFGAEFDGDGNGALFGYASVIPKDQGSDVCGYVNLDGQLSEAPPWGTKNENTNTYSTSFQPFSVAELGINLTAFGLDNKLSSGTDNNPCFFPWITYMVKTRTSNSFTASLSDMAGPFTWGQAGVSIVEQNDAPSISCESPTTTLTASPFRDDATYTWSTTDGNIVDGTESNGTITKTGGSIEVDAAGNYTVTMTLQNGCEYTGGPIEVTYNNAISCNPSWKLTKTATEQTYDAAGDVINYTIQVENDGDVDISAVTVADPKASSGPTYVSGDTGNDDILASGETWVYSASYTITQADMDAGSFENTATASGTIPNGTLPNAEGSETVTAVQNPSWTLTKSSTDTYDAAGDVLNYTIDVENTGNVSISQVDVTDDKATTGPTYESGDENENDVLDVGETWTYSASSTVTQADVDAGSFTNEATATATPAGGTLEPAKGSKTINAIQNPSLTLVKTGVFNDENENGRADSGETISYTFLVTNTGNVSLTNVTVSDPMVTVSGGPISLAVGEDSGNTFTATYTIDQDDVNAGEVVNTASADSDETDPVDSEETTNLPQVPFLEFSKSTDTEEYSTLGEVIRYKLTLVNSGNLPIEDVEVSDPLATTGPDYLVGDLNSNGILEIGEAWIYVATVSITQKHLDDGFFINIAKATGKSVDGENLELTDQQEIKAVQKPSWTLTKSSSDTYDAAGDVLNYTIAVKNTGNVTISNVVVTDPKASSGPTYASGDTNSNNKLDVGETWTYTASATVTQADVDAGSFTNEATATGTPAGGTLNPAKGSKTVDAIQNPSWTLTKSSSDTYDAAGDVLNYTIAVKNTGNVTISNVVVTDPKASSGPTYASGDTNSNNKLDVGETWTYTASATVTQADVDAGSFTNEATATGTPAGGTLNPAKGSKTVDAIQNPSWTLTKSSSDTYDAAGDVLNYTIAVKNTGNVTISNVVVTDPKASSGPTYASGDTNSNNKLDVGETWTYTASATVTQADVDAGSFTNEATATGTPAGGTLNPAKGSKTVNAIQNPSWTLTKSSSDTYDAAGDVLNYTIAVKNTGNVTISNVVVTDPKASSGPTYASGDTNSNNKLDVGETWTYTASATVTQADVDAGSFTNEATATGTPAGGTLNPAKGDKTVEGIQNPSWTILKTAAEKSYGEVGESLNYTITVTNTGNVTISNVVVVDPKATTGPTYLNGDANSNQKLDVSETWTYTATYLVKAADIEAGSFTNEATVTGTPAGGTLSPAKGSHEVVALVARPNIESTPFNTAVSGDVSKNDTYPAGSVFTKTSEAKNGVVVLNSNGTYTYQPKDGFTGVDTFTYKVCLPSPNGTVCEETTVTIVVGPNAVNDKFVSLQNREVSASVVGNDQYPTGSVFTATSSPANGKLTFNSNGTFTYVPNQNFTGKDTFTYKVCFNEGDVTVCEDAIVEIEILPFDTEPDVNATFVNVPVNGNVATNDKVTQGTTYGDPGAAKDKPAGSNPQLKMNSDGTFSFVTNVPGIYVYMVPVCPPVEGEVCTLEPLTITVLDINVEVNAPIAHTDIAETRQGKPVTLQTLSNDRPGGKSVTLNPASVKIMTQPKNGTVTVNPQTGNITYTPNAGFVGVDTYTYQVCDTSNPAKCVIADQKVTVFGENAPNSTLASDDFAVTANKLPVSGNVLKNDTDSEGNSQTVTPQKVTLPQGDFEIKANGEYTFTPKPGFIGPVEIVYQVCDNGTPGACAKATIYLLIVRNSIEAINDNFQSKPINGLKGGVAGNVLTNDLLNDRPVKADEVVISILSDGGMKGVTIDALGNLNVPKGTPVGTYIVHYSICEVVDPTNCSDAIAVVEVFHGVDLAINKRAEETDLWEGDEFAYILTVGNVGDTDASEVVVIDNLPAGLEYKSAQLVGTTGLQLTTVVEGQKITMRLPTLKAGQVVEIKLTVKARPLSGTTTETILNTASVASKETELKPADNTSTSAVRIQPFFIPNVITPNGDRKNDAFEIKGLGKFRSNEIVIFNRYGDHVFQKKGYQNDWIGEGLVAGTYFYILSVVDINGNPTEFKGWIQLIRE